MDVLQHQQENVQTEKQSFFQSIALILQREYGWNGETFDREIYQNRRN